MQVLVETSARHVHLCREDMDILFGKNSELTKRSFLSQPGQFSCMERVDIIGPNSEICGVSVLGPLRKHTQVEISLTDARKLSVDAPIRDSGDIDNTPGCKLRGPAGTVVIKNGLIVAKRHIHLDPKTAKEINVADNQKVCVKIESEARSLIFDQVYIRVNKDFLPAMHIDTDESNAAGIFSKTYGDILV